MSDVTPDDALQVAQRALSKVNELEGELRETEQRLADVEDDLAAALLRLSEQDEERAYRDYTLDEKIGMVREHAFRKASDSHGRAKLTYDDVMWEVFDGEPGAKHCYKLLRLAAGETDHDQQRMSADVVGFRTKDPDSGTFHLAVDAERAKQSVAFCPENKAAREGGR